MEKVFYATYKTDNIFAEGFVVFSELYSEIEGVFALDYMYLYQFENYSFLNLKTFSLDKGTNYSYKFNHNFYEFFNSKQDISPNSSYVFFDNTNSALYLDILDEVLNVFTIQDVMQTLYMLRK